VEHLQFTVTSTDAGERIDIYLSKKLNQCSRSQIQKLIANEKVLLRGKGAAKNTRLTENDIIEITGPALNRESNVKAQDIDFNIIYEDEYIVAVNKPAGLVVHPGNGVPDGTLVNGLVKRIQMLSDGFNAKRPGIVHRLDKETSGVLIVAKTNQAHNAMASLFQSRNILKKYIGFCIGTPSEDKGLIDLPLDRNRHEPIKRAPSPHGKEARTEYQVLKVKCGISAMCFKPHTGRTHQIRVHASAKGFPILADKLYGGGNDRLLRINPLDRAFTHSILKCFNRHALHAYSISFVHPFSNENLMIVAPVPEDFQNASFYFESPKLFENSL
jgi:23S rRNA pseudouridine1911/1915/1917 synthase